MLLPLLLWTLCAVNALGPDVALSQLNGTGDVWGWNSPTHIRDMLRQGIADEAQFDDCPFAPGDELGPGYVAHYHSLLTPIDKPGRGANADPIGYMASRAPRELASDDCTQDTECFARYSDVYYEKLPGTTFDYVNRRDEVESGAEFGLRPKDIASLKTMLRIDADGPFSRLTSSARTTAQGTEWIRKLGLWRNHGIILGNGSNYDDTRETPPHINSLAKHTIRASTGVFVRSAGRAPTALTCFKVNITDLLVSAIGVTVNETLRAFPMSAKMNLARGHASTVAMDWAGRRLQSRSQRADAPHAMDAAWNDFNAEGGGAATNGYPPGGITWSRDGRTAGPPYAEVDATARGGQAYAYGLVAWDVTTGVSVWGVSEYADGNVTTGRIAEQAVYRNETRYLQSQLTLDDAVAIDGGFLRDTVFPAPPPEPTVEDARAVVGRTIIEPPPWYKFGMGKPRKSYNDTLVQMTLNNLWLEHAAHFNGTRDRYRLHLSAVASPASWAVLHTCRQDVSAPTTCWNLANPGRQTPTAHAEMFGVTCMYPTEKFVFPECERNETVRETAVRVVYDRRVDSFTEYRAVTRGPSAKYDRTCHYKHVVCVRGVKASGFTWLSNTCDTGKSPSGFGPTCRRTDASTGGPQGNRRNPLMDLVGGWTEPLTGMPMCVLGYGGPGCAHRCGDTYGLDQVGRKKAFPHEPCHAVKWDTCATTDPPSGCEFDFDCLYNDEAVTVLHDWYWSKQALTLFELDPNSASHAAAIAQTGTDMGAPGWTLTPEGTYVYATPIRGRFTNAAATSEALAESSTVNEILAQVGTLEPNSYAYPASFKARNRGCNQHGVCFAQGHEDECLCAANVDGRFCDRCAAGYYGYSRTQPVFSNPHDANGGCTATDSLHPYWDPEEVARYTCNRWKGGFLGSDPLSVAARNDPTLLTRETLDSHAVPVRSDSVAGEQQQRRRLQEEVELPPDLAALRDLFSQPGAGPILKPPVTDTLGCGGSCWGYRPEDGLTDNEVWSRNVSGWDPVASTGVYNLVETCGGGDPGPTYTDATETWEELYERCGLYSVTDASVWIQVAGACAATPDADDRRVLANVCNFGDVACRIAPVDEATEDAGMTPKSLFGCTTTYNLIQQNGADFIFDNPADGLDGVDLDTCRTPLDLDEVAVPGGWHTADLPCTDADMQCVSTLPDGGAVTLDSTGAAVLNDTTLNVLVDPAERVVIKTPAPCVECAPVHAGLVSQRALGNAKQNMENFWEGCAAACNPAVFYATNPLRIPAVEAVRDAGGDAVAAMRMTGLTPATAMGCPLWDPGLAALEASANTATSRLLRDGPSALTDVEHLTRVAEALPDPRWIEDWTQCMHEVFYADGGPAASLFHGGDPFGNHSTVGVSDGVWSSALLHGAELPVEMQGLNSTWPTWLAASWDTPINGIEASGMRATAGNGTGCAWDRDAFETLGSHGWTCNYTVRLCTPADGDTTVACVRAPRPVWQAYHGITPQGVLGCPTSLGHRVNGTTGTWHAAMPFMSYVLRRLTLPAELEAPGSFHICDPDVFYALNPARMAAAPSEAQLDTLFDTGDATRDSWNAGANIVDALAGVGIDLELLEPKHNEVGAAQRDVYTCAPRTSVFRTTSRVVNDSTITLGKICGGKDRAATCDTGNPACEATGWPLCSEDETRRCACAEPDGCQCATGSGLDPASNCVSCLPFHTWVEDGTFTRCDHAEVCYNDVGDVCGGHGECHQKALKPSWEQVQGESPWEYANVTEAGVPPLATVDGYTNSTLFCMCDAGYAGDMCTLSTTACGPASRIAGTGAPDPSAVNRTGLGVKDDGSLFTVADARVPGGQRPVGGIHCKTASTKYSKPEGGCSVNAIVIPTDWTIVEEESSIEQTSWTFKVQDGWTLGFPSSTYQEYYPSTFPGDGVLTPLLILTGSDFEHPRVVRYLEWADGRAWGEWDICEPYGGRYATMEDFAKASDHTRRVYVRFYQWLEWYIEQLMAGRANKPVDPFDFDLGYAPINVGGSGTLRIVHEYMCAAIPRNAEEIAERGHPAFADWQASNRVVNFTSMSSLYDIWSRPGHFVPQTITPNMRPYSCYITLPPACVVDTCAQGAGWSRTPLVYPYVE